MESNKEMTGCLGIQGFNKVGRAQKERNNREPRGLEGLEQEECGVKDPQACLIETRFKSVD